jgi:hypothetical protein
MAFSADNFSANVISAVTVGCCEVTQQLNICPVKGSRADWMSAAVVPGAKLLPITTKGPELAPRIVRPTGLSRTVDCPLAGLRAERRRASSGRRLARLGCEFAARTGADCVRRFFVVFDVAEAEGW